MWLLLITSAFGGKLAEGYRGIAYGSESNIDQPPSENCSYLPSPGTKWLCFQTVGGTAVTTGYIVEEGIYYGVVIQVSSYSDSLVFLNVVQSAYGSGNKTKSYQTGVLADMIWSDGDVMATWSFNDISGVGSFVIFNRMLVAEVDKKKKAKAALSTGDL